MLRRSRVLAGMLVAVFGIAMLPTAGWANASGPLERAAECHGHMPSMPAPSPAQPRHQCCAAGHQWAIPGSPVILHPVIAQVGIHDEAHDFQPYLSRPEPAHISDSPPVTTSLRV